MNKLLMLAVLAAAWPVTSRATDERCNLPSACELWSARYDAPGSSYDTFRGMAISLDGSRLFLTGDNGGRDPFITVAYEATSGTRLWAMEYNDVYPGGFARAGGIRVSDDGSTVFVAGYSEDVLTGADFVTVAYDGLTGLQKWAARYHAGDDQAIGLAVSPDGTRLYVGGASEGQATVVVYDAVTGEQRAVLRHAGLGEAKVFGLAMSPDGSRQFLVGHQRKTAGEPSSDDFLTVAFDLTRDEVAWAATYDGPSALADDALRVDVSASGERVFVAGQSNSATNPGNGSDYATVGYDVSTGDELWVRRYSGTGVANAPYALTTAPRGDRVYVTGVSWSTESQLDALTIAYDGLTGNEVWNTRLLGGPTQWAWGNALRVAPGGARLYVVGYGQDTGNRYKFLVVSYDSETGAQVWKQEWPSLNSDQGDAGGLALSPDGTRLYVGGTYYPNQQVSGNLGALAFGPFALPPSADLQAQPASGEAPLEVVFSLSGQDPDGVLGEWDLDVDGDGMPDYEGTGAPPASLAHTYTQGGVFTARLTIADDHGAVGRDEVAVTVNAPVGVVTGGGAALSLRVGHNPITSTSRVFFALARAGEVRLRAFDIAGRPVATLAQGWRPAGEHQVVWNPRDLPNATYLLRLEAGGEVRLARVTRIRCNRIG